MTETIFYRSELIEFVLLSDKRLCFDEHCHVSDIVITAMLDGTAVLSRNGKTSPVCRGDIFSVLPYENHSLMSDFPVSTLTMCINKRLLCRPEKEYISVISAAVHGMTEKGLPSCLADSFLQCVTSACTEYLNSGISADPMLLSERRSIEEHPESSDTLDESGKRVYMSKYHFIRRFREISGLTPHKFRIQNRIRQAQRCLANGGAIPEAALMSGFYDQSHFDRYFKKIVGISPKDYVDSLRNFLQE